MFVTFTCEVFIMQNISCPIYCKSSLKAFLVWDLVLLEAFLLLFYFSFTPVSAQIYTRSSEFLSIVLVPWWDTSGWCGVKDDAVSWQNIFNKQCWISTISLFICGIHQVFALLSNCSSQNLWFTASVLVAVPWAAQVHHPWNNLGKYRAESHQEGTILNRKQILLPCEKWGRKCLFAF